MRAERGDLREEDEDVGIRLLEQPQRPRVEPPAEVDDDVVEPRPEQLDDALEVVERHAEVGLRADRGREDDEARGVARQVRARQLGIGERLLVGREAGDVVARRQVEVRRHLAELQVEVDEQHARRRHGMSVPGRACRCRSAAARKQDGRVHRQRRGADAALRAEEGDQLGAARAGAGLRSHLAGADEVGHDATLELAVLENSPSMTSSAPASRNAIRASTSWAGATTRIGVTVPERAVRSDEMAPEAARPSATMRSNSLARMAATASAGVVTDVHA